MTDSESSHRFDSITASELRERGGLKWGTHDPDVLPAWVAEMDFSISPPVRDALRDCAERSITGYPYPEAELDMAEAASEFQSAEYGWTVDPTAIRPVPDVVEGIRRAVMELTPPGSPVVLHTPVYYPFFTMVDRAGRDQIRVPAKVESGGRATLDLDGLERAFAGTAAGFVLCNPWNPTGRSFARVELIAVADLAHRHGVRVIADEIHGPLVYPGGIHTPFGSLDHPAAQTAVTVTAASKMWNLPGLKCAQVICNDPDDLMPWDAAFPDFVVGVATPGLLATTAAYRDRSGWRDEVLAYLGTNRTRLGDMVGEMMPDIGYHPTEGTYLAWLDFSPRGLDRPAEYLLKEAGVALSEGEVFGTPGHARLNFATPTPILEEIVTRIAKALP